MSRELSDSTAPPLGGAPVELPASYIREGMTEAVDDTLELADILARRSPTEPAAEPASTPAVTSSATRETPAKRALPRARPRPSSAPVIKPSVVHIPAPLMSLVAAERQRSGRSNGQILIAAIEDGHDHLVERHRETSSIGGRLFTARSTKPALPVDQPLTPLNIRLYEQDYEVLDRLVAELGAGSRSRLATLALARYLEGSA